MATVVFFTPHQDDETLSMGPAVRKHVEVGHEVHVVLMTLGVGSAVRPLIGLDEPTFIAARDDELLRAARQLGLPFDRIHIGLRYRDGSLTVEQAKDVIRDFYDAHPGAWAKSYTNLPSSGRHTDHIATGQACVDLLDEGLLPNLRLYVEPWLITGWKTANPTVPVTVERAGSNAAVLRAFDEYKLQDTIGFKWGIGYRSVGHQFDAQRPDPVSYYHVP